MRFPDVFQSRRGAGLWCWQAPQLEPSGPPSPDRPPSPAQLEEIEASWSALQWRLELWAQPKCPTCVAAHRLANQYHFSAGSQKLSR